MNCPKCGFHIKENRFEIAKSVMQAQGYPRAFMPWTKEEDRVLREMTEAGAMLDDIVEALGRPHMTINKRIELRRLPYVPKPPKKEAQPTPEAPATGEVYEPTEA